MCQWLEEERHRRVSAAMGKTFYCYIAWVVDPWIAKSKDDLMPPPGHRDAGRAGIPAGCLESGYVDPATFQSELLSNAYWKENASYPPDEEDCPKTTAEQRRREIWVVQQWWENVGDSRQHRWDRLLRDASEARREFEALSSEDKLSLRGREMRWRAETLEGLRGRRGPGQEAGDGAAPESGRGAKGRTKGGQDD
jgi:hypothetical protein